MSNSASSNNSNSIPNPNIKPGEKWRPNIKFTEEQLARISTIVQDTADFIDQSRAGNSIRQLKTVSGYYKYFIRLYRSKNYLDIELTEKGLKAWMDGDGWKPPKDLIKDDLFAAFLKYQFDTKVNEKGKIKSHIRSLCYWMTCVLFDEQIAKDLQSCFQFQKTLKARRTAMISKQYKDEVTDQAESISIEDESKVAAYKFWEYDRSIGMVYNLEDLIHRHIFDMCFLSNLRSNDAYNLIEDNVKKERVRCGGVDKPIVCVFIFVYFFVSSFFSCAKTFFLCENIFFLC